MIEPKVKSKVRIDASLVNVVWLDKLLVSARMARKELGIVMNQVGRVYAHEYGVGEGRGGDRYW